MTLELGVVEEALAATLIVALELPIGLTVSLIESSFRANDGSLKAVLATY